MPKSLETTPDHHVGEAQPKVIFVDWYKTLSNSLFWIDHPGTLLSSQELSRVTHSLFDDPKLIDSWMKGFTNSEAVSAEAAARTNLDPDNIFQELVYSAQNMKLYDPEVLQMIQAVRDQGRKVVLATDNMDTFERWTVAALNLESVFDGIITSPSRGALKSEIQGDYSPFFGHYLSLNGIKPSEAVLVDDSSIDEVVMATGLGFRRVDHPNRLASILSGFLETAEV